MDWGGLLGAAGIEVYEDGWRFVQRKSRRYRRKKIGSRDINPVQ